MKKTACLILVLAAAFAAPVFAQDEARLIYPSSAADSELDCWTPAKRVVPPAREEVEFDPVTPIGQIRGVLDDLESVKSQNASILEKLGQLQRETRDAEGIGSNVDALVESSRTVGAKLDDLKKTTENLRATVEAAQKTAGAIERIRTSRLTDCAVIAILGLVLIQLIWKAWSAIAGKIKARAQKWREMVAAYEEVKSRGRSSNGAD